MRAGEVTNSDFAGLLAAIRARRSGKRVIGFDVFDTVLRWRVDPEQVKDAVARRLAGLLSRLSARNRVSSAQARRREASPQPSDECVPSAVGPGAALAHGGLDWRLVRHRRKELELALGREAEARGDDHEFRLRELLPRWLAECGAVGLRWEELLAYELDCKRRASCPTPGIMETLRALRADGVRLIYVSDMYLGPDDLHGLLRAHGLAEYFAAGYCSSTCFRTKRSGRLFQEILAAEGVAPRELLFVGDNPYSDVDAPRRLGIDVVHVRDAGEISRYTRLKLCRELSTKNRFWLGRAAREAVEALPRHLKPTRSPEYALGTLLAPAFIAFTRYVIEQVERLGLERLIFLSREGFTFLRLYRRIARALGRHKESPPAAYAGVSRVATFLPSLDALSLPQLRRLLRQYDRQSLRSLLRNLSLPEEEFVPLAHGCGWADPDALLDDTADNPVLREFLADPQVQQRFTLHRDRARTLLTSYLRQKGFFDGGRVGLVDIGWKGSIQDNLFRAARHASDCPEVHGLYFGLAHVAEDDLPGSYKHAYMADTRRGDLIEQVIFKNGPVFEMFASATHGGVVGYRPRRPGSAQVRPIVKPEDVERRNFHRYASEVFAGIEDYVREYLEVAPLLDGTAEDWRPYVLDQLRRYILYPTVREARQYLKYSHMESFGVFRQTTYEFKGSWRKILLGGSPLGIPKRLIQTLERQFWPESYLRRLRVPLANFLYDLLETRYASRILPPPAGPAK